VRVILDALGRRDLNGTEVWARPEKAGLRWSSRLPKTLGESKDAGTLEPVDRPVGRDVSAAVWQLREKAVTRDRLGTARAPPRFCGCRSYRLEDSAPTAVMTS